MKYICGVCKNRGLEFSSYKIELWNQVTLNDVTLRITNSKLKSKKFYFYFYRNSSSKLLTRPHKTLLTQRLNFYFPILELLTQSWKIKNFTLSKISLICGWKIKVSLWVTNSTALLLFHFFELLTRDWKIKSSTSSYQLEVGK